MDLPEKIPTFNLKAVLSETGIKAHTVRAWEKKYGLPRPTRTEGKHRIYTQHDISIVKWLMARLDEGMTISRAAELWHNIESEARDPLDYVPYQTDELTQIFEKGEPLADIRQGWINNCLMFEDAATEKFLTQAFAVYPIKMVCLEILQKGLAVIGDLWFRNEATVQQEHFATAKTLNRLEALLAAAPPPTRLGRLLVACPPYEEHTISVLMMTLLLRYQGWNVSYLGANVPLVQLEKTVKDIQPDLVILGAQRLETAASLAKVTEILAKHKVASGFGGAIFNLIPSLQDHVSGHYLGETIEDAIQVVNKIMTFGPPIHKTESRSVEYEQALRHFDASRYLIDFDIRQKFDNEKIPFGYLEDTNSRLKKDILAALSLGKISLVNGELKHSQQLMKNHGISSEMQQIYFRAYHQSARTHLKKEGRLILNWLDRLEANDYTVLN